MADTSGFLSQEDRRFLRGEKEYTGEYASQNRYQRRKAIAERARKAFGDFALLNEALDSQERKRIFDPDEDEVPELHTALRGTISFLYRALEGDVGEQDIQDRSFSYNFNSVFEPGVRDAEAARQPEGRGAAARGFVEYEPFSVQLKRNPPTPDLDAVVESLAENGGRSLSTGEIQAVVWRAAFETAGPKPLSVSDDAEQFDLHTLAQRVADHQDRNE